MPTPVLGLPAVSLPYGPFVLGPTTVGHRYQGISLIAEGGMGAVYRGHALAAGNPPVAIKLALGASGQPGSLARFQREIAAVVGLDHPNIVRTLDHGQDDRWGPFIVMELLKGETLDDLLGRQPNGRLAEMKAREICLAVCGALIYAHTRETPLMHRDIKPANVFLEQAPGGTTVKVMDFGLARAPEAFRGGIGARQKLTEAGMALGTFEYIAPEQCEGKPGLASDVYALGIMLYLMIEGRFPFPENIRDPLELAEWHKRGVPRPMEAGASPELRELVSRMIEKNPKRRPSLREVRDCLGARDERPTLVGVPIISPATHEMLTERCASAVVLESLPPADMMTIKVPEATVAVAIQDETRRNKLPASKPSPSRERAGEIAVPAIPRNPPVEPVSLPSNKIFVETPAVTVLVPARRPRRRLSHVFASLRGFLTFGWLVRRVSRLFSARE